ncbi:MAG TPA: M56 family metallopeptidase [Terracidiphilus sp.]|nr:M56 family metallopeptidase [Terracidiphilus sp.]
MRAFEAALNAVLKAGLEAGLETWVLNYLLNSLWQVPLVFLAALVASRLARTVGPHMEHRIWVGALLLQVILPFCHLQLKGLGQQAWGLVLWFRHGGAADGQIRVVLGPGIASGLALPRHTAEALAAVAAAYLCALVYFAGRLGWGLWTTESMRRRATPFKPAGDAAISLTRFQRLLGIGEGSDGGEVEFASSPRVSGPATVGVWKQTLLLPPAFLDKLSADELDALLAHEFAHMQRWDFAKNLLYGIVSLPVAYHPLLWLTRARFAETREMVCDDLAAEAVGGREGYARSLLRLARMLSDRKAPRILHAIGILDANIFERRVMYLTRRSLEVTGARQFVLAAACALLAIATCTSALALRMDVTENSVQKPAPASINVKADSLVVVSKVQPVYPAEAKKNKISGSVVLAATIGKDGTVEKLRVVSGPSALQRAAVDAVKQWRYQPFLLNGNPIVVKTNITVRFTLAD